MMKLCLLLALLALTGCASSRTFKIMIADRPVVVIEERSRAVGWMQGEWLTTYHDDGTSVTVTDQRTKQSHIQLGTAAISAAAGFAAGMVVP